jgi:uncharacterized membrane protein YkoI|tara:strand:- start:22747 stop:23130 length:384 start_codon:yes stop_codon:yes gene_type:complete
MVSVVCSLGLLAVASTAAATATPPALTALPSAAEARVDALKSAAVPTAAVSTAAVSPDRNNTIMLAAKARISAKQAAASVKQKLGAKVLSVKLIESKGPPVYRVKTLSKSGVVKVVFVDGQSGKVFD